MCEHSPEFMSENSLKDSGESTQQEIFNKIQRERVGVLMTFHRGRG